MANAANKPKTRNKNKNRDVTKPRHGGKKRQLLTRRLAYTTDLVNKKRYEDALVVLDDLLKEKDTKVNNRWKYKILLQLARLFTQQGQHAKAARAYASAGRKIDQSKRPRFWLRAAVGQCLAHIKRGNLKRANIVSKEVVRFVKDIKKVDDQWQKEAKKKIRRGEVVNVNERPYRPSVALCKLANALMDNGLISEAKPIYKLAIDMTEYGASRARTALARIYLS